MDLVGVESLEFRRGDRCAEDAKHGTGMEAARHHRGDELGGHAFHDFVGGGDRGEELLA